MARTTSLKSRDRQSLLRSSCLRSGNSAGPDDPRVPPLRFVGRQRHATVHVKIVLVARRGTRRGSGRHAELRLGPPSGRIALHPPARMPHAKMQWFS